MKNIKNIITLLFLTITISSFSSQPISAVKSTQEVIEQVDKKMSVLDQIVAQATIIVDSFNQIARVHAKKELMRLMKSKDLSIQIKDLIQNDIEIIKTAKAQDELNIAYQKLLDTYKKINTQADGIETIIEATVMVENASPESLQETIAQAQQKIEDVQQEEQGFLTRMYNKAKRFGTVPVDYIFGKEASYAKNAFYAAVGLAVITAGTYGMYQYGVNDPTNVLVPGLSFMMRKDNPENVKSAFIDRFTALNDLEEHINNMSLEEREQCLKLNSHILTNIANDVNRLEKALSVFMSEDIIKEIKNKIQLGEIIPHKKIVRDAPSAVPLKRRFFGLNPFYE